MTSPVVDLHVHMVARQRSDCAVSPKALPSLAKAYMAIWDRIDPVDLAFHFDRTLRQHIVGIILDSGQVEKSGILALDGVYCHGKSDRERMHVVTSNDYVHEIAAGNRDAFCGARPSTPRARMPLTNSSDA